MNAQRSQRNYHLNENEISRIVIKTAIDIHRNLGPGLLESAYKECMSYPQLAYTLIKKSLCL